MLCQNPLIGFWLPSLAVGMHLLSTPGYVLLCIPSFIKVTLVKLILTPPPTPPILLLSTFSTFLKSLRE